jgi:hypothetical protein
MSFVETTNSTHGSMSFVETKNSTHGSMSFVETTNSTHGSMSFVETTKNGAKNCISLDFYFRGLSGPPNQRQKLEPHD